MRIPDLHLDQGLGTGRLAVFDDAMGAVDVAKEAPNVSRMKVLGAKVISVTRGTQTLKDAVDAAFEAYLADPVTQIYCIGSVVGPHPFPMSTARAMATICCKAME